MDLLLTSLTFGQVHECSVDRPFNLKYRNKRKKAGGQSISKKKDEEEKEEKNNGNGEVRVKILW